MLSMFFGFTTALFAALAVYFSYREERRIRQNRDQERQIQRKVYELNLISDLTEKIGYSLNIESISESIALTVEDLFDLSTASYGILDRGGKTIQIKTFIKENVNMAYIQSVSKIIFDSMCGLEPGLKEFKVQESFNKNVSQVNLDTHFDTVPSGQSLPPDRVLRDGVQAAPPSYFNIPLVVNNEFCGMINISSRKKGIYQDQDMTLLYRIVNKAQRAIRMLNDVIETEKAKLDSMILSLPTGAILFGFEPFDSIQGKKSTFNLSVINQAARKFLKLSPSPDVAEALSRFPQALKVVENIKNVIVEKKSVILREAVVGEKTFTIYITPVFMHNTEKIIGVSLVMRDMTLEKKLERVRSEFTSMVVHELRAPISAIKGASSLLLSSTLSHAEEERMMHVISDSARNMLGTISELLDIAKVEEGKFAIRKVKSDLSTVVSEHVEVFSYAAREKGVTVNLDIPQSIPEFFFDPGRIGQVINNLVSNALKFTREGGRIDIKIEAKGAEIQVLVSDSGIGIPEAKIPLLFTKFGQIHEGFEGEESSGLGLFISQEIIVSHGGKIWIESEVGRGTKVYFTLPFIREEEKTEIGSMREFAN